MAGLPDSLRRMTTRPPATTQQATRIRAGAWAPYLMAAPALCETRFDDGGIHVIDTLIVALFMAPVLIVLLLTAVVTLGLIAELRAEGLL